VVIKLKVALGRYVEINGQGHPLHMTWMEHGYDPAFAPVGAIWVREENCIAGPSRIFEIVGLERGYKAPCHYGQSCTRKDKGCKYDHGRGDDKAAMRAEKAQEKKEPIYQAPSHEATEAVAAKQLEDGGVTSIKNGGATALENGGVPELLGPDHVLLTGPGHVLLIGPGHVRCAADQTGPRAADQAGHAEVAT
jgi:hypothetical protein